MDVACKRGYKEWGNSNFLNSLFKFTCADPPPIPPDEIFWIHACN